MLIMSIFMLLLACISILICLSTEEEIIKVATAILAMLIYVMVLMLSPWPLKLVLMLSPLTIALWGTRPRREFRFR